MHAARIEDVRADFSRHLVRLKMYIRLWNEDPDNVRHQVRANPQALFLAIKSTHDDIVRYKAYHLADPRNGLSNSVKMSAYLCKWISRFKVIELVELEGKSERGDAESGEDNHEDEDHEDVTAILLNGAFALNLCRSLIGAELKTPFYFDPTYSDEFQYDLLYREIGEDGLLHIFQMIFTAVGLRRAGVLEFDEREEATSIFDNET